VGVHEKYKKSEQRNVRFKGGIIHSH